MEGVSPRLYVLLAILAIGAAPAWALNGRIHVHDPSTVIQCDGKYYVYGTGRGIMVLTSSNGFDWQRGPKIFDLIPISVKSYVPANDGRGVWAPDVIKLNGQYCLYYAVSKWDSFVSAVGLVTSPTLDPANPAYKWTDRGMIVHSVAGEDLNAIDPGVMQAPDGRVWLCYGSYHGTIQLVELDPKTGLRIAPNSPAAIIGAKSEASEMIHHGGYYYLFTNHGTCCQGYRSTYHIVVGRSATVTGPYLDRQGHDMADGGGTLFVRTADGNIGPGHFGYLVDDGVEKFSCHYEAVVGGSNGSVLDIRPLLWTAEGWPMAGTNIGDGIYTVRSDSVGAFLEVSPTAAGIGSANQKFYITPAGGGFYKIMTPQSEMALTAVNGSIQPAPFTGSEGQLWKIDELTDGTYRIQSKANHEVLTATAPLSPGNGMILQAFTGATAQRWAITNGSWLAEKFRWLPYLP